MMFHMIFAKHVTDGLFSLYRWIRRIFSRLKRLLLWGR